MREQTAELPSLMLVDRLRAILARTGVLDLLLVLTLIGLAWFSHHRGFEVADMVSSDALYLFQILDTPLLEYRPPPPNRVFPDVLAHALVMPFGGDLLQQKIIAGILLFAISALCIGLFKGRSGFTIYVVLTVCCGFGFLNSGYHYSLPLTLLLFQLARRTRAEGAILFLIVFCDVLVLMPLAMLFVRRRERAELPKNIAIMAAATIAGALYSEFSEAIFDFALVLPPFVLGVVIAHRMGMLRPLIVACCILLPLASMLGVVPARYALPVAASMLLLLLENRQMQFDWRYLAVPAALAAIFLSTMDQTLYKRLDAAYGCLVKQAADRGISALAVEYWTARPLAYKAREMGSPLTITQTDFQENDSDAFMAPYSFYGQPTHWAVKNLYTCATYQKGPKSCNQAGAAPLVKHEPICGVFELYQYQTTVPKNYSPPPAGKLESIGRHLRIYSTKVGKRIVALVH